MKNLLIIIMFFLFSCEKNKVELTGFEGTVINEKGEKMKSFKLEYYVNEFIPNGFVGGNKKIKGPVEIESDNNGFIRISEYLKYRQSISIEPFIYDDPNVDSIFVSSLQYINLEDIMWGHYYRNVILTVRER